MSRGAIDMRRINGVEGWRQGARRRLPRVAFDFIDGGADDEVTLWRNRTAFDDVSLVPRVLRGVGDASARVELFGQPLRLPVLLAPTGAGRIAGPEGEIAQARAASAAGTISVLSGFASVPAEQVAWSVQEPQWFQLYLYRDRALTLRVIEQVKRLGFSALVVTADAPVAGNRERDVRNGLTVPLKITPRMALGALRRPAWAWHYLRSGPLGAPHAPQSANGAPRELKALADYVHGLLNSAQSWEDLRWLRGVWEGPLLLKGVLRGDDAELALAAGCDGVIVSNHGGRQLDGTPASIEALGEVIAAVGGRAEVLIDGGIRRGTDVVKALSLGAKACLVGRPWLFGLAAGGEAGVGRMLEQLHAEIVRTLQLLGAASVAELGADFVRRRPGSGWERVQDSEHAHVSMTTEFEETR
jgi:(S)-mandelate dehydrogenase